MLNHVSIRSLRCFPTYILTQVLAVGSSVYAPPAHARSVHNKNFELAPNLFFLFTLQGVNGKIYYGVHSRNIVAVNSLRERSFADRVCGHGGGSTQKKKMEVVWSFRPVTYFIVDRLPNLCVRPGVL